MNAIANRYAESLFEIAKEEHAVKAYQEDMEKVQEVFVDSSIVRFFSHYGVTDELKMSVLKQSFEKQVGTYVYNFLLLLIKKRRIAYIREICAEFQSLCYDYFCIKVGKVYTPYELSDKELLRIENAISVKVGKKVKLRMVIDTALIGGIRVEVDNHIYDDSLSYKLESLKKELLRK